MRRRSAQRIGEIRQIPSAIAHRSDKDSSHAPFDEHLKAADVLRHHYDNPQLDPHPRHRGRLAHVEGEFQDVRLCSEEIA
ncbi:hypothetical protein JW848_09770 [Candidatus Bipolaricaulota bacterium]|nr:hypothetical protein [Candidatus Bipolaricaulota bacterium]